MNLLNLPDWNIEKVEDSARDYRVHATYTPEPGHCPTCGLFARTTLGSKRASPASPAQSAYSRFDIAWCTSMPSIQSRGTRPFDSALN